VTKFPAEAPKPKVMGALRQLGFEIVREGKHISLRKYNEDGSVTPMTIPNHRTYKRGTLRVILTQAGISRVEFLKAYHER